MKVLISYIVFLKLVLSLSSDTNEFQELKEKFLQVQPPISFSSVQHLSTDCKRDLNYFVDSLNSFHLWALEMHDATAKLSAGILTGNVNQYGNFDQCLNVITPTHVVRGKYCLASVKVNIEEDNKFLKHLKSLALSYEPFKGTYNDSGHIIHKTSFIQWGLCLPSACSHLDAEAILQANLNNFTEETPLNFQVRIDQSSCYVKTEGGSTLSLGAKITILIFSLIFATSIASTIFELKGQGDSEKISSSFSTFQILDSCFGAFSLIKNYRKFRSTKRDPSDIKIVHFIRIMSAFLLLLAHKCMVEPYTPYLNRNDMVRHAASPWIVLARYSILYTESFLMLSGLLTSKSCFGKLKNGKKINLWQEYVGRYMRIFPSIAALMLFVTFLLPLMGSGPLWSTAILKSSEICERTWWYNILFVQNYLDFDDTCLFHTYHTAVDTQLFILAPLIAMLIWKWPRKGCLAIMILMALSTVARFVSVNVYNTDAFFSFGSSISQVMVLCNTLYAMPYHRFTSYGLGLLLGYVLQVKKEFTIPKPVNIIMWTLAPIMFVASFTGPLMKSGLEFEYNPIGFGAHAALAPIVWGLLWCWIIFTAEKGPRNWFHRALEWDGFLVAAKLSYCLYLSQFVVFYYNVGMIRTSQYFNVFTTAIAFSEYTMIVITSFLLMMFVELPFINIKNILLKDRLKNN